MVHCTETLTPQKRSFENFSADCPETNNTDSQSPSSFCPIHMISNWVEPNTTRKCVSVAILLPSGVGPGNFSVRVIEGGRELEVCIRWPEAFSDLEVLHKKWIRSQESDHIEVYHPKLIGFENCLKQLREKSSHSIESHARIALPIVVDTHIYGKYNLGWKDNSSRVVYVDLKAYEENYAVQHDEDSFELL